MAAKVTAKQTAWLSRYPGNGFNATEVANVRSRGRKRDSYRFAVGSSLLDSGLGGGMDDRERDPKTDPVIPQEERELDVDVDETAVERDEELEDQ